MEPEKKYADNRRLIAEAQAGDRKALEALVVNNTGLVRTVAARFPGRGYDREDLIEVGHLGLLKAIRTFDLSRDCTFSTYAVPLIFGEIRRFLRDDGPIKVSREQKRLAALLSAERAKASERGEELRLSELAARVGVSPDAAADALDALSPIRSLSEYAYADGEGPTLEATLSDEEESERVFDRITLAAAIEKLPTQRKKIILLRYYRDLSQQKVADLLGLTQVKVSREEKKAVEALRAELS